VAELGEGLRGCQAELALGQTQQARGESAVQNVNLWRRPDPIFRDLQALFSATLCPFLPQFYV
jgi:hypothetical protein